MNDITGRQQCLPVEFWGNRRKSRVIYGLLAMALVVAEVCIALYASGFWRGSLGDVLVVILLHCALRVIFPQKPRLLPLYVFLFACAAEALQALHLLRLLGLEHIAWLRILAGTTFSWGDVLCYAAGCAAVAAGEYVTFFLKRKRSQKEF